MHNEALTGHSSPVQRKSYRLPSKLVTPECWNLKGLQMSQIQDEHHRNSYRGRGHQSTRNCVNIHQFLSFAVNPRCTAAWPVIHIHLGCTHAFPTQAMQAKKGCISNSYGDTKLIWLFFQVFSGTWYIFVCCDHPSEPLDVKAGNRHQFGFNEKHDLPWMLEKKTHHYTFALLHACF